ncbi:hypothetical protein DM860_004804 [Cuscuta australis]|uniref:Protein WUSCHEL n=1 Tax=Cuscuta australis TaxID=267555 RepID=A0A328DLF7_9ASTE|nr:hypothetical protein DM860_004804 [Cuscuta australis]
MEPQHYYHNQNHLHQIQTQNNGNQLEDGGGGNKNSGAAAGYICRQSSTRWTPTTEQIRILKELYYNNGVRSPSAEQIQRISAKLRQYGKIEGKNVFYWFQNHKARERQKKRLTAAAAPEAAAAAAFSMQMQRGVWRSADHHCSNFNNVPQASTVGQIGNYGYGSTVAMERSFRNCSISAGGGGNGNGGYVAAGGNYGWVGIEHHHPYAASAAAQYYHPFLDHKIRAVHHHHHADEDQETLEDVDPDSNSNYDNKEPETLPLFPVHADHHITGGGGCYYTNPDQHCLRYDDNCGATMAAAAAASLELSLNSSYNFGNTSSSHHFA